MKTTEYQNKFYEESRLNYDGMYVLNLYTSEITNIKQLRRALNKEGLKTKIDSSGNYLFAIDKRQNWIQYN
jgi:hypothetical protein